jgi:hypothetical protein
MTMTDTITTIGVSRLAGNIGAEITGVDAGNSPSDYTVAQVRQALLDHKVVFLRYQDLDYNRQVAFASRLGPLTLGHPTREPGGRAVAAGPHRGRRPGGRPLPRQVKVVLGAVTVVDSDGAAARRLARTEVAKYLAVVAELGPVRVRRHA